MGLSSRGVRAGGAVAAGALMIAWVALLWLLEVINALSHGSLDGLGIEPRRLDRLWDVLPAAFVHFSYSHVAANTLPLLILGFLAALRSTGRFLAVALLIIVVSGLGVWLVAPAHTDTAGASGLIFGLFAYLLVRGFVDRRPWEVVVGLVVGAIYGSILWGLLPNSSGVSWQAHLFGLAGGVLAAFVFRERRAGRRPAGAGRAGR